MVAKWTTKINGILVRAGEELPAFSDVPEKVESVDNSVDEVKTYEDMTFDELKAVGKQKKIKGYHLMSEEKLREAVEKAE